jgi:protein SCO1/2
MLVAVAAAVGLHGAPAAARVRAPDFTLVDQSGHRFQFSAQAGRPRVLFFGYSHCGDVCPLTLEKLAHAKTAAGAAGAPLEVVFITVDPQRDSPAVLLRFINHYDPSFFALTGSSRQLARVYAAYHVSHRVLASPGRPHDYDVEHSSFLYYVGADGRLRGFGDWTDSQQIVTQNVRDLVARSSAAEQHGPHRAALAPVGRD